MGHKAMLIDTLEQRWNRLLPESSRADERFHSLIGRYSEPHRHYHGLSHLVQIFAELDAVPLYDPCVEWAAWYHDAIYVPGAAHNESESASLAHAVMVELGQAQEASIRVCQFILATRTHQTIENDRALNLFLDADLSILGASPDAYLAYANAIREEHRQVPDRLFRLGRQKFLKNMLAREHLFLTPHFRHRHEQQARENLIQELNSNRLSLS
jgi:predicted metal-dependent HD superfamily phosphohydrolase